MMDTDFYHIMMDKIPSNIAVYEAVDNGQDFIFIDFNKAAEKTEKINKNDLIGKRVDDIFPGVKKFGLFDVFVRVYKTGKSEFFDDNFYEDDRISGWRKNEVIKLPDGNIMAIYEDLTKEKNLAYEAKEAEEELLKKEGILKYTQQIAHIGNWIFDIPTGDMIWSDEMFRICGEEPGSFTPSYKIFLSYLTKDEIAAFDAQINRAIKTTTGIDLIHDIHLKDGTVKTVHVEAEMECDTKSVVTKIIGTTLDITDLKRTHSELEERNSLFSAIIASTPMMLWTLDLNGIVTLSMGNALSKVGLKENELVGLSVNDLYKDNPVILESVKNAIKGESFKFELQMGDIYLHADVWQETQPHRNSRRCI